MSIYRAPIITAIKTVAAATTAATLAMSPALLQVYLFSH